MPPLARDGFTLGDWEDVSGTDSPPTPFGDGASDLDPVPAYLVGRMLDDPTGDSGPWDENDNPHVGPSQVISVLQGQTVR